MTIAKCQPCWWFRSSFIQRYTEGAERNGTERNAYHLIWVVSTPLWNAGRYQNYANSIHEGELIHLCMVLRAACRNDKTTGSLTAYKLMWQDSQEFNVSMERGIFQRCADFGKYRTLHRRALAYLKTVRYNTSLTRFHEIYGDNYNKNGNF